MGTTKQTQMTPEQLEASLASPECAAFVAALADAVRAILARRSAVTGEADEAPPKEKKRGTGRKPPRK